MLTVVAQPVVAQERPAPTKTAPSEPGSTTTVRRGGRDVQTRVLDQETAPDGRAMRAGSVIVKFRLGAGRAEALAAQEVGAQGVEPLRVPNAARVKVEPGEAARLLAKYRARPDVEYAEPDYIVRKSFTPNDPSFGSQWGMTKINTPQAWDNQRSSSAVKVAVLDCGVYGDSSTYRAPDGLFGHPDLRGKVVLERDFTGSPTGTDDYCNHGTHVAGTVAASTNNGVGVTGVGFDAGIMNGKVLDDSGSGSFSWVINGIIWATDNGAKVINMSLGASGACSAALQDAINYAWSRGVVIAAAAGNGGSDRVGDAAAETPGNCNHVLAVAATDQADARASFSNYGANVDLAAPGVGILSTDYAGRYSSFSGTSMATPHVAGLAALVWATPHGTSNRSVVDRIAGTAATIGGTGSAYAFGRIDAAAAVGSAPTPTFALSVSRDGSGSGTVTGPSSGIDCGTECSATYAQGTSVTVRATPSAGSTFAGWSGDCAGLGDCTVTMSAARSVKATFNQLPSFALSVSMVGTGSGSVSSAPGGIDCGADCEERYLGGTVVTLSATPSAGARFAGWGGDCAGLATCTLTIDAARRVTATFDALPPPPPPPLPVEPTPPVEPAPQPAPQPAPPPSADLAVRTVAQSSPSPPRAGTPIRYVVTVTNSGPSAASNVQLNTVLAGVHLGEPQPSRGVCRVIRPLRPRAGASQPLGGRFTCELGTLASGQSVTIRIGASRPLAGVVTSTSQVSSGTADPHAGNNRSVVRTTVRAAAATSR